MSPTTPPPVTGQVLFERVYRLGRQPELLVVEVVTATIAVLSVVGPPPPSLHAAVGTAGVRLWGAGTAAVAGLFFTVAARERRHPPRQVVLELVALVMHVVLWSAYVGYSAAVHFSGYTTILAVGGLVGVMLVRVSEIVQDIRQPHYELSPSLTVPDLGGQVHPGAADPP